MFANVTPSCHDCHAPAFTRMRTSNTKSGGAWVVDHRTWNVRVIGPSAGDARIGTEIRPSIPTCSVHANRYLPAEGKVKEKLGPPGDTKPESYSPSPPSKRSKREEKSA